MKARFMSNENSLATKCMSFYYSFKEHGSTFFISNAILLMSYITLFLNPLYYTHLFSETTTSWS